MNFPLPGYQDIRVVFTKDEYGFQEVLDSLSGAKCITIVTYNLFARGGCRLLDRLKELQSDVSITLITAIPNRWEAYYGVEHAARAKQTIEQYIDGLRPERFSCALTPLFCFKNHAKIIATEHLAYIGSQNFSDSSAGNYECGVLLSGRHLVQSTVDAIVDSLRGCSLLHTGHAKSRFAILLRAMVNRCSDLHERVDGWFYEQQIYKDSYKEVVTFRAVEDSPLSPFALREIVESIEEIVSEMKRTKSFVEVVEPISEELLRSILEIANDDGYSEMMEFSRQSFVDEKYSTTPPSPDDEAAFLAEAEYEADDYWCSLEDQVEEAIHRLRALLKELRVRLSVAFERLQSVDERDIVVDNTQRYFPKGRVS